MFSLLFKCVVSSTMTPRALKGPSIKKSKLWMAMNLPQGPGSLQPLIQLWILHHIKEYLKIIWGHLSKSWSWTGNEPFNKIMILSALANPPRNGSKRRNGGLWSGLAKARDLNWNAVAGYGTGCKKTLRCLATEGTMSEQQFQYADVRCW